MKKLLFGMTCLLIFVGMLNYNAKADATKVNFSVDAYVCSGNLATYVTATGKDVKPGGSTTITFELKKGSGYLSLDLGAYGSGSISFDTPLNEISIPVAGISGLASVNADLSGRIDGYLTVDGPATLSTTHLIWTDWGKKSVTLTTTENAKDGDEIVVTLNLEYALNIGVTGRSLLGDITLISPQTIAGIEGSPPVTLTVNVKEKKEGGGIPGFEIVGFISAAAIYVFLYKKDKDEQL